MNAEHEAWMKWKESEEGKNQLDPETLKAPKSQATYLSNRLWRAFTAGMDAGKQIATDRIIQQHKRLVEEAVRSTP